MSARKLLGILSPAQAQVAYSPTVLQFQAGPEAWPSSRNRFLPHSLIPRPKVAKVVTMASGTPGLRRCGICDQRPPSEWPAASPPTPALASLTGSFL